MDKKEEQHTGKFKIRALGDMLRMRDEKGMTLHEIALIIEDRYDKPITKQGVKYLTDRYQFREDYI